MSPLLAILLADIVLVVFGGTWGIKVADQKARDRRRKTYRLNFPAELSPEQVITWLRSISGTLRGGRLKLTGAPSIVFETFATHKGIIHRLKVPYGHEPYIIPQLRVSGINATPEEEFEDRNWVYGVEVGIKNSGMQLRIYDPADVSTSLLSSLQSFGPDEALLVQWVVTPTAPTKLPEAGKERTIDWNGVFKHGIRVDVEASKDEIHDRRDKLAEPNFSVVLRVAGHASTDAAGRALVERVRMALAATRTASVRFHKRLVRLSSLRERIRAAHSPVIMPGQLSAPELAAFIAWPMGRPIVAGLAPSMARHLPPSATVPSTGRVIGTASAPGAERPVAVSYENCVRHTYCIGGTGSGKSVLLANMAVQDMKAGHGVILVDAKSDKDALFWRVLREIPDNRLHDVIILNVEDTEFPVGFNILDQGESATAISQVSQLIANMYSDMSKSLNAPRILYHALHALAAVPGHTFIDLPTLLENQPRGSKEGRWQDWLARDVKANAKNKDVVRWLQELQNMSPTNRDTYIGPVANRTWEYTNRPEMKAILGQRKSGFQMRDVILNNKILLVYVNGTKVGAQTASLVGALIVDAVWQTVQEVQAEKSNFLYLDEFADFLKFSPIGIEPLLTKARGSNLGLVLAHQHMKQLSPDVKAAVLNNTATQIRFKLGADDARDTVREIPGHMVTEDDLKSLQRFHTVCTIATDDATSTPVTVQTSPPGRATGNAGKAEYLSQQRYGKPREDVERELDDLPGGHAEPGNRPRPPISGAGWR